MRKAPGWRVRDGSRELGKETASSNSWPISELFARRIYLPLNRSRNSLKNERSRLTEEVKFFLLRSEILNTNST